MRSPFFDIYASTSHPTRRMTSTFQPIAVQPSLSDIAYREIRAAITQGRLQPGERLIHRALAKKFGISPTPVRDAIQRLVSDGALVLDDRGIAQVPIISAETYCEILNLRIQLEGYAAASLASQASTHGAVVDLLTATHDRLVQHKKNNNIEAALYENEQFHSQLIKSAGMPILEDLVRSLWLRCGPSLRLLYDEGYIPLKVHPHIEIINALKIGNAEQARAAIERDLRHAGEHIKNRIRETQRVASEI